MARPAPLPPSVEPPTWAPPDTRAAWSCQSAAAQPRDVSSTIVSPEAWGDTYMAHLRQACPDFVKAEQAFESGHLRGPEECHLDEAHSPLVLAARNADGSPKPGLAAFALCVQGRPLHVGCSDKCMNCAVPRPLLRSSCPYLFTAHIPPHLLIMADAAMRGVGSPAHASLGSALGCAAEMAASTQEVMSSTLPCSKLFVHPVTGRVMANVRRLGVQKRHTAMLRHMPAPPSPPRHSCTTQQWSTPSPRLAQRWSDSRPLERPFRARLPKSLRPALQQLRGQPKLTQGALTWTSCATQTTHSSWHWDSAAPASPSCSAPGRQASLKVCEIVSPPAAELRRRWPCCTALVPALP